MAYKCFVNLAIVKKNFILKCSTSLFAAIQDKTMSECNASEIYKDFDNGYIIMLMSYLAGTRVLIYIGNRDGEILRQNH